MESGPVQKLLFSSYLKQKVFAVRKVPYKTSQNQKSNKANFSPLKKRYRQKESASIQAQQGDNSAVTAAFSPYKETSKKYNTMKEALHCQKQNRIYKLKQREEELGRFKAENDRLHFENKKLLKRRESIKFKIDQLRGRNQLMRQQQMLQNEQFRVMNMQNFRSMALYMRYQNGVEIDTDHMTYEELLQLEEKIGKVSKGITEEQFNKIVKTKAKGSEQVCSVCYNDISEGEEISQLPCQHYYHVDCIKGWLLNERTCPLCKQEIIEHIQLLNLQMK